MRHFVKLLSISLLLLLIGKVDVYGEITSSQISEISQEKNRSEKLTTLPLALPDSAVVWSDDNSKTGKVTKFNFEGLTLNDSNFISIEKIKRITFQGSVWITDDQGSKKQISRIARCVDCQYTWQRVPVTALTWQSPSETAELRIGTVISGAELQDILDVAANNIYVIDEIVVDSPEAITIKAIQVAR